MNMQPLVTYWSSPELFLKSKSASCADTQCIHLPYFIMLSAHHDLVDTKGNKLGGGCCGWVVVLAFKKKEKKLSSILQILCHRGCVFYFGIGRVYILAAHLSDVAKESRGRLNSNLTPGWMSRDHSWKELPSLTVLLHVILCPSSWQHGIPNVYNRRGLMGGDEGHWATHRVLWKDNRWDTQWTYKLTQMGSSTLVISQSMVRKYPKMNLACSNLDGSIFLNLPWVNTCASMLVHPLQQVRTPPAKLGVHLHHRYLSLCFC